MAESTATRLLNRDVLEGYDSSHRLVIFVLALMANPKMGAYPSDRILARKCGVGQGTVRAAKARAEDDGVIARVIPKDEQPSRRTVTYYFPTPSGALTTGARGALTTGARNAAGAPGGAPENDSGAPESLACIGTLEQLGEHARPARETPPREKPDTREPWQVAKDAEAAAKLERERPRTPEELAEIERRRQHIADLDPADIARRDAELEAELSPEQRRDAEERLARFGISSHPIDEEGH